MAKGVESHIRIFAFVAEVIRFAELVPLPANQLSIFAALLGSGA